ncbi:peroxin 23-like protein [Grosmannia clavigera kw1407]|uniref:Peroxin 23-like protein n=1 Tax=Grosmannia clavigera (strain kw1407 / UAMH 11150) TaxID=655863 RepID=F0XFW8_GROCL|nr:peroxin 23-like protein [Grosmannia clavigera kw1407]EFX04315.1 peroxin 23-like protein [Grosmannia clavigera kw1407]
MPRITSRSSRRAPPLKDSDFDHEIHLFDNGDDGDDGSSHLAPPPVTITVASDAGSSAAEQPSFRVPPSSPRGRSDLRPAADAGVETAEAVDVLYENERGCFLCGVALFSARALGNLDPSPWTNAANRTSPTDIRTAQVPDPTWQWAWPAWRISHDDGTDEDGWQYSFMFARPFAWRGPTWYSSFVRRRVWTRKRVKRAVLSATAAGDVPAHPHMLTPDYFVVLPAAEARRSSSRSIRDSRPSTARSSMDTGQLDGAGPEEADEGENEMENGQAGTEIDDSDSSFMAMPDVFDNTDVLMRFLHSARIDREKIEAVDNYLAHAGEDLVRLQDVMHEIMAQFVFQAPRRKLLTHLTAACDAAVEVQDQEAKGGEEQGIDEVQQRQTMKRRVGYLAAAVRHADEEVRRLEYWSDVKAVPQHV